MNDPFVANPVKTRSHIRYRCPMSAVCLLTKQIMGSPHLLHFFGTNLGWPFRTSLFTLHKLFFLLVVSTFQATDKILWLPIVGSSQIIINVVKEIKIRST
jgi:hypothetical protein